MAAVAEMSNVVHGPLICLFLRVFVLFWFGLCLFVFFYFAHYDKRIFGEISIVSWLAICIYLSLNIGEKRPLPGFVTNFDEWIEC